MVNKSQEIQKIQTKVLDLIKIELTPKIVFKNSHTLRLTKTGERVLSKAYDSYSFDPPKLNGHNLINLLRKMKYPYYIDKKKLVLFTEQDSFLAKLAGAQGWLDGK
jgi:hypothetical protein